MHDESTPMAQPYEIVSVQKAQPPHGVEGTDWHRYIIVQGTNTIQGYRQGNLGAVTRAVKEIVAQLNERRIGKRGRVNLVMPAGSKPADK